DGERLVERGVSAAAARDFRRRGRQLVAFPAGELVIDEIDGELTVFQRAPAALKFVHIVPARRVEWVRQQRRSKGRFHLLPRLSDLEPLDLVLGDVIALVDVELVDGARYGGARTEH